MRDRIEAQPPTEEQIDALIAEVRAIEARVQAFTVALSTSERAAAPKMRTGGERIVAALAAIVGRHHITLPAVLDPARMTDSLTHARRIEPLAAATRQLLRRLDDTVIETRGQSWGSATAIYTTLARIAGATPGLTDSLRPIVSFFALGRRKEPPPAEPEGARTGPGTSNGT